MDNAEGQSVKQCCAAFYGSDLARLLMGNSFHPGGTALTGHLGKLLKLGRDSLVLDVASGGGTSAFHLAESFGCQVVGVDLSVENIHIAREEAARLGLSHLVRFQSGDAERLPFEDCIFDSVICECAFCTFPSKQIAAEEFRRVLKPGGLLGISDLTRTKEPIPELEGLLSWVACIGDALPVERYSDILHAAGFSVGAIEDHSHALIEMVRRIQGKLLGAEILAVLGKLALPGVDPAVAKRFAQAAFDAIHCGRLGYVVITAQCGEFASGLNRLTR